MYPLYNSNIWLFSIDMSLVHFQVKMVYFIAYISHIFGQDCFWFFSLACFSIKIYTTKTIPVTVCVPRIKWLFFFVYFLIREMQNWKIKHSSNKKSLICQLQILLESQHSCFGPKFVIQSWPAWLNDDLYFFYLLFRYLF